MIIQFEEPTDIGAYAFPGGVPIDLSKYPVDEKFGRDCLAAGAVEVHAAPEPEVEVPEKPTKKRQSAK